MNQKSKKRRKLKSLLIVIWIFFIAAIAAFSIFLYQRKDSVSKDLGITSKFSYSTNANPEVNALVITYLNALASADQNTLKSCVTDPTQYDNMTATISRSKIITMYSSVNCYSVKGYKDDDVIVYAVANITIANITSTPLDVIPNIYIVKRNGKYLIDNEILDKDTQNYVDKVNAEQDIQDIYKMVKEDEDSKSAQDPALKEFMDKLN